MAFTVVRRRREIGIRTALGAGRGRVVRGVLATAMRQLALGLALGVVLGTGIVAALDQGTPSGRGVVALLLVAALMTTLGLGATLGPALRALRVPATEALRHVG